MNITFKTVVCAVKVVVMHTIKSSKRIHNKPAPARELAY